MTIRDAPLTVTLTQQLQIQSVYSVDDAVGLDISGCEYADLVNLDSIINATPSQVDNVSIINTSKFLEMSRQSSGDDKLGVLLLYIHSNKIILIVDDEREIIIKIE